MSLISSYMNVFRREDIHHFEQHIFQELKCFFIPYTEISLFIRYMCARQFRIGRCHFFRMRRHFNFRNYRNVMLLCIGYDFSTLLLSKVSPYRSFRTFVYVFSITIPPLFPILSCTPGRKACQTGIFLYFNTPAGCVRQMKVQTIEFVVSHGINLLLHEIHPEEMTRYIKHHPTILKSRFVDYSAIGYLIPISKHLQ